MTALLCFALFIWIVYDIFYDDGRESAVVLIGRILTLALTVLYLITTR